jgi:hypothetical protein
VAVGRVETFDVVSSAHATPAFPPTDTPMPSATASRPTLPMLLALAPALTAGVRTGRSDWVGVIIWIPPGHLKCVSVGANSPTGLRVNAVFRESVLMILS